MRKLLYLFNSILNLVYFFHKLCPCRNKVSIISRQGNEPSVDIKLLEDRIRKDGKIEINILCRKIEKGIINKVSYLLHMLGSQMHAFATSKVVIIDGYCIAASVLKHKKQLKIIQMWHAMGALKEFGYSTVGKPGGRSAAVAEGMHMHRNYDVILAGSEAIAEIFSEAFGYNREMFEIIPLPRTDLLRSMDFMNEKKQEIIERIPELKYKQNILYAPTFRDNGNNEAGICELINGIDFTKYNLIIKLHPLVDDCWISDNRKGVYRAKGYSTMDLLSVCDIFITDYSATVYEAALTGKPVFLYRYDLDEYISDRGLYENNIRELPWYSYTDGYSLLHDIDIRNYDISISQKFAETYIADIEDCTGRIVDLIYDMMWHFGKGDQL